MDTIQPTADHSKHHIRWYRTQISGEDLKRLNQRSDLHGLIQAGGFLGLLALTGSAACLSVGRMPWPVAVGLLFMYGTCWQFIPNAMHELVHNSVFKTQWLNMLFVRVFGFLGVFNFHYFWNSHKEHHKFTLHPPDDLEVVLPIEVSWKGFAKTALINPVAAWQYMVGHAAWLFGRMRMQKPTAWDLSIFPESELQKRRQVFNWARLTVLGHAVIVGFSLYMHWWMVPVVTTLPMCYGGWLAYLCNVPQHAGLVDNVPDFRLCCRTVTFNPLLEFLYWHMNYHTEHHMYPGVPCYNLRMLHHLVKPDLPETPSGLVATWRQISAILKRQKQEPTYQYVQALPPGATPYRMRAGLSAQEVP